MHSAQSPAPHPAPPPPGLFVHYSKLYFNDELGAASVEWSSKRMTLCAGTCAYDSRTGSVVVKLSEPILKVGGCSQLRRHAGADPMRLRVACALHAAAAPCSCMPSCMHAHACSCSPMRLQTHVAACMHACMRAPCCVEQQHPITPCMPPPCHSTQHRALHNLKLERMQAHSPICMQAHKPHACVPTPQYRTSRDLKMVLLHEMIHAKLFVDGRWRDDSEDNYHGPIFKAFAKAINTATCPDHQVGKLGFAC